MTIKSMKEIRVLGRKAYKRKVNSSSKLGYEVNNLG